MRIGHSSSPIEKSIFLAGPTPRRHDVKSWRPEAISILEKIGFDGTVYVPEPEGWQSSIDYDDQVHWEWEALNAATVVAFWIPRDMIDMPALTTNVEFGLLVNSGKVVVGYPEYSPKNKYIGKLADRFFIPIQKTLYDTMCEAKAMTKGIYGFD